MLRIIASVPILSVAAGILFFKERMSIVNVLGILITLLGIYLVLKSKTDVRDPRHFVLGIILLVIAVVSEVGHASFTKVLSRDYSPQVIVMYQFLIGSIYFLPLFLSKGLENYEPRFLSWDVIGPILALAALCSSIAFSLWALTIQKLGVAKSSVFLAMMCVATALAAEFLGQEHLCSLQWIGIAVAVVGIVLSQYTKHCFFLLKRKR